MAETQLPSTGEQVGIDGYIPISKDDIDFSLMYQNSAITDPNAPTFTPATEWWGDEGNALFLEKVEY